MHLERVAEDTEMGLVRTSQVTPSANPSVVKEPCMYMIVRGSCENVHLVGEVVPVLGKKVLHIDHLCSLTLLPLHLVANM